MQRGPLPCDQSFYLGCCVLGEIATALDSPDQMLFGRNKIHFLLVEIGKKLQGDIRG